MKVTAILKGKIDSNGQQPIQIRINQGDKRRFIPLSIKVKPSQFANGKVKSHPSAAFYNSVIRSEIEKHQAKTIEGKYLKTTIGFFDYVDQCFKDWGETKSSETYRQYKSEKTKLRKFKKDFRLVDVTPQFLYKYQGFCFGEGNENNTVWKSFKFIKVIIRKAFREKLIPENPFDTFASVSYKDPKKNYLTRAQVQDIDDYCEGCQKELQFIGTWFIIGCFTGMRFSDMRLFRKNYIKAGRLVYTMQKTGVHVNLPMSEKMMELFRRVDYKPLDLSNAHVNRCLKIIAEMSGIKEKLSWHTSRHTFATMALSNKIPIAYVQKMMGHKTIRSTAIYAQIVDKALDEEFQKMV